MYRGTGNVMQEEAMHVLSGAPGKPVKQLTPDSTDTYYVIVTGESGCTATADYWINVTQETPTIAATPIL